MGLALKVVTKPPKEPVTLDEAKVHLKVEYPDDDAYITSLIKSGRTWAEEHLGRALVETEFDYQLDAFPCGPILLPRPPLISVTSVMYVGLDGGAPIAWDAANRRVDAVSEPARITPTYLKAYPSTLPVTGAVTVRFKSGFCLGTDDPADEIPEPIRLAILMAVHKAHSNRNPVVIGTIVEELPTIVNLLAPYRFLLPAMR